MSVYLETLSVNDPYVAVDAARENEVAVIVNMAHPHVSQIEGSIGLLNYLRHCMYDGLAEWQARRKQANLDPDNNQVPKGQPAAAERRDRGTRSDVEPALMWRRRLSLNASKPGHTGCRGCQP